MMLVTDWNVANMQKNVTNILFYVTNILKSLVASFRWELLFIFATSGVLGTRSCIFLNSKVNLFYRNL